MEQQFQNSGAADPAGTRPGTTAVDRGAELLVRVLESEQPVALTELASASGIPKSTASRLLSALERQGLVEQDGERGRLRPGPAILRVAERSLLERGVVELARPSLDALGEASGETINLAVPAREGVEHLAQVDGRHFLGAGQWLGRPTDYHCTAVGKVFMAFGRTTMPARTPAKLTEHTITDLEALRAELEVVRRDEFATAIDELEAGPGGDRRARAWRRRPGRGRAQHLWPHDPHDARADRRAQADPDRGGPTLSRRLGYPERRTRRMTPRGDPAAAVRRDAGRQRAAVKTASTRGSRRASSPSGCCTTR